MYVECYDEEGARVYDMILRYTLQDLQLARAIKAIKVFIDPREALFIGVVKLEKASTPIYLPDMASYKMEDGDLKITIDNENYTPHLLKELWQTAGRVNVLQPDRYKVTVKEPKFDPETLLVHNPSKELKRKVYDALFRIMPEGFRMTRNASEGNMVCLMSSDEIIDEKWNKKFEEVIEEVKNQ
jgi:putative methanogenesis marker protein 17